MMTAALPVMPAEERWRPVAYVTMEDSLARARVVDLLQQAGWQVISQPTGFHLLREIAAVIEGEQASLKPALILVDAHSRGCTGTSIAAGLRDLGITIPIVLIAAPGETLPISADASLHIVDSLGARATVASLIGPVSRRT